MLGCPKVAFGLRLKNALDFTDGQLNIIYHEPFFNAFGTTGYNRASSLRFRFSADYDVDVRWGIEPWAAL